MYWGRITLDSRDRNKHKPDSFRQRERSDCETVKERKRERVGESQQLTFWAVFGQCEESLQAITAITKAFEAKGDRGGIYTFRPLDCGNENKLHVYQRFGKAPKAIWDRFAARAGTLYQSLFGIHWPRLLLKRSQVSLVQINLIALASRRLNWKML